MIYFTTFILALFCTQIVRALPQGCNNPVSLDSSPDEQFNLGPPSPLKVTYDPTYDNPSGSLNSVACSNGQNGLVGKYPTFSKLPTFPFIGGAYDIVWNSTNCGGCWRILNKANGHAIHLIGIDTAGAGFNIATAAFKALSGGTLANPLTDIAAQKLPGFFCGI
jgi:Cerato-platanin